MSSDIELEKSATARKRTQADAEPLWRELARAARLRSGTQILANGPKVISETPTLSAILRQERSLRSLAPDGRPASGERHAKDVLRSQRAKRAHGRRRTSLQASSGTSPPSSSYDFTLPASTSCETYPVYRAASPRVSREGFRFLTPDITHASNLATPLAEGTRSSRNGNGHPVAPRPRMSFPTRRFVYVLRSVAEETASWERISGVMARFLRRSE
jgi:hypothetical protein